MKDKEERKKDEKKSILASIMSYGARDKAKKAKPEPYLDRDKMKKLSLKRKDK